MLDLPSAVEKVVRQLREDILRGRLRAGERLPSERELSDRVGVHRGAVREARRTLAQLGLVEIAPGGARVAPVEAASLDVLEHLLELDEVPDPAVVGQIMEAAATIFAGAAVLFAERASDAELANARELVGRVGDQAAPDADRQEAMHELVHRVVDGSGKFVLGLMRKNLRLQFHHQLEEARAIGQGAPPPQVGEATRELDEAFARRDGEEASRLIRRLFYGHRDRVVALLTLARSRRRDAGPEPSSSLLDSLQRNGARPAEDR
jgi:DNA-binding FadR family transcriptional regulator